MAELIAPGTTTTSFFDFTVNAGATKILFIKPAAGANGPAPAGVEFELAHKTSGGDYAVVITLTAANILQNGTIPAGTWGVRRLANVVSAGMDVEG